MSSLKAIVIGTIAGTTVGIISLAIAYVGLLISDAGAALPMALVVSTVIGSTATGSSGVILGRLLTRLERSVTAALIAIAAAALIVLPANFANSSLVPALIFATAVVNGLIIAQAIGPLCSQVSGSGKHYAYMSQAV